MDSTVKRIDSVLQMLDSFCIKLTGTNNLYEKFKPFGERAHLYY